MVLLIQLIAILVAYVSSKKEYYATYPYRENIAPRGEQSKRYHFWGGIFMFITLIILALLSRAVDPTIPWIYVIMLGIANSLWYWLLFDILYSLSIGRGMFYLGSESFIDRLIKNILKTDAGRKKAYISFSAILVINIILCFLLF